jgi:hypothetical protein
MKTQIFWKIYVWFLTVVVLVFLGGSITGPVSAIKIIDIPLSLIALAGLFGFAYEKSILMKTFWQALLPVVVVWDLFANFLWNGVSGLRDFAWLEIVFVIAVYYMLFSAEYVALYLYAFRSEKIWNKEG